MTRSKKLFLTSAVMLGCSIGLAGAAFGLKKGELGAVIAPTAVASALYASEALAERERLKRYAVVRIENGR